MPIFSYIVCSRRGCFAELVGELSAMPRCEVLPAEGAREVAILLVESETAAAHDEVVARLHTLPSLQSLALTFASVPTTGDAPRNES